MDENTHNPTISCPTNNYSKNFFLIKYGNEEERRKYSDIALQLTRKYELKDFHIAEEKAFEVPRILYNMKTILKEGEDIEVLEKRFLQYLEN